MKASVFSFAILLVVIIATCTATTKTYGACSCKCWNSYCEHPTSQDQCNQCSKSITGIDGKTSMDGGVCWIKVGNIGLGDCSRRCLEMFGGCSNSNGYEHYTYGNMCWCKWRN